MNAEELEKMQLKKIMGHSEEHADGYYIYLQLSHGKQAVFWSETPIYVDVEQTQ